MAQEPTDYPPPAFAFSVAIAASSPAPIAGAFQEVTGIDPKMDVEELTEGGNNSYVRPLPGVTKHSNLVLKRGYVVQGSVLAAWVASTVGSSLGTPITTQTLDLNLLGPGGRC